MQQIKRAGLAGLLLAVTASTPIPSQYDTTVDMRIVDTEFSGNYRRHGSRIGGSGRIHGRYRGDTVDVFLERKVFGIRLGEKHIEFISSDAVNHAREEYVGKRLIAHFTYKDQTVVGELGADSSFYQFSVQHDDSTFNATAAFPVPRTYTGKFLR